LHIKFISRFFANMGNSNKGCSGPPKAEAGSGAPPASGRFADPWWRKFDVPTDGFRDATGFVSRLPLRLESTEMIIFGTVDAAAMWAEFADEDFQSILVGDKAVLSVWFNNFTDTDCGGSYYETWYNTFVTRKNAEQLKLPMESPMSVIIADPRCQNFLIRVVCGDTPDNPGAAMKAIVGGRSVFGFPKHPEIGNIKFAYEEVDGKKAVWQFEAHHKGKHCVTARIALPETDENHIPVPLDFASPGDLVIGAPKLGGTHKGHNGAHQVYFGQTLAGTQNTTMWNPATDSITFGNDDHYAQGVSKWSFEPMVKGHIPNFKIAATKPSCWMTGEDAAAAVLGHEAELKAGKKLGAIDTPWEKM